MHTSIVETRQTPDCFPLLGSIRAGFPSPAEEELIDTMTLDQMLIQNPQATYLIQVSGDSMTGAGILPGDIALVERGRTPRNGQIILAEVDGQWTIRYLEKKGQKVRLLSANPKYENLTPTDELRIGGVLVGIVRKY